MKPSYSTTFIALILGFVCSYYYLHQERPIKYEFIVEHQEGQGPAQFFCRSGAVYSGQYHVVFPYSKETSVGHNLYKYYGKIPCAGKPDKLRFDFTAGPGKVIVKSVKIRTFRWIDIDLETINTEHLQALNAIKSLTLSEQGLELEASANDPHVQILNNIQSFREVDMASYGLAIFFFSLISYILLRLLISVWVLFANTAMSIESIRYRLGEYADNFVKALGKNSITVVKRSSEFNYIIIFSSFLIASAANVLFIKHIYQSYSHGALSAFFAAEFRVIALLLLSVIVCSLTKHYKRLHTLLLTLVLLSSIAYLADALLYRINGMHISHGIGMLLDGGVGNFFRNLKFTKLTSIELIIYPLLLLAAIIGTYLISLLSVNYTRSKPINIKNGMMLIACLAILAGLLVEQKYSDQIKSSKLFSVEQQELPLYPKFHEAKSYLFSLEIKVKNDQSRWTTTEKVEAAKKRDIYLFILESVRHDVTNQTVTPNLEKLRQDAIEYSSSISDGNATHYGWYSIVNSQFPLHWESYRNTRNVLGSGALQLFKNAGYTINVHSAKDLNYLDSKRIMFGEQEKVYDYLTPVSSLSAPERDIRVTEDLKSAIAQKQADQPTLNIIFYDSTHYPYTWPENFPDKFQPYAGKPVSAISLNTARDFSINNRKMIVNRYKNSIHFTDHLLGQVISALKAHGQYKDSIVVAVGDHGQQFMEHNFLMHGKSLFAEDLSIPLILKVPQQDPGKRPGVASQIDIMPTLLDAVGLNKYTPFVSDGTSLLDPTLRHGFAISAAAGIQNTPFNMILETPEGKLLFDLEKRSPLNSRKIFIKGLYTKDDKEFVPGNGNLEDYRSYISKHYLEHLGQAHFFQLTQTI
ncbi:sulfatase-like hydrolase/transferase [Pseudoteredinibacter isoporae]|uniref:Membrane-anchored protein YejM (Alkaline phosphatase superfamily) n=1 Tax=Pseudoteredinibacter isoporae TaxID=570281 RepID=A0A7X0JQ18_9GAMM|nr:sulfatase-like hydrolase/transferase [Pseudoteredinibacter isoporae]MBB6520102.1 membrane-anchored protein YejM (alkaline phosphatase superfamily) [Pseudoteredinibacter isoporae]NHO85674.1 sulfatase-like hydrolase/transferase [Pseudoteredinibacter isoporae]NIB25874.1 sulfatase-like hydrolase/transferase [Pseudoteredinibacter isoporae]